MPIIHNAGKTININPTADELNSYQKHGLKPQDRKPSDYLRMVARTFSSFRATPAEETVVSYIHGFDVSVNSQEISIQEAWVDKVQPYNVFHIKAGACMIDNQLIDIYEDTYYLFESTDFLPDTKYGIVIEYDFIEQYNENTAKIRFISYESLHFPRAEDKNVVSCEYTDESLDGNYSTTEFSGRPGLLIATFKTSAELDADGKSRQIVQSNPAVPGDLVKGIDPQFLSKLYIQNYKLLFEYFGAQSRAIYSSMGMTNANFYAVAPELIYKSSDPVLAIEEDLRSGDMCYFDSESGKYKRSIAARQKFSQVVGLYLNEVNEGNHLIYTGGVIAVDEVKHNLSPTHQLLTMVPGTHYYLEDADSLFDTQNQIRTIDNYVLADSSGRISNRFYPNSVRVGFATACNQIVLNIDHSAEIGTGNLLSLFGNYDEYKKEYQANQLVLNATEEIAYANKLLVKDQTDLVYDTAALGENLAVEVNTFFTSFAVTTKAKDFTYAMYRILSRYFVKGFGYKDIYETNLNILPADFENEVFEDYATIRDFILNHKSIYNIRNQVSESLNDIGILLAAEQSELTSFLVDFKYDGELTKIEQLEKLLQNDRYVLGDGFDVIDNFENEQKFSDDATDYASNISTNNLAVDVLSTAQDAAKQEYFDRIAVINKLISMQSKSELYKYNLDLIIDALNLSKITLSNNINITLVEIQDLTDIKTIASGNIMNPDVSKIDIFQMDDHQRRLFNYTYLTDRLQKRLLLVDKLNNDLLKVETTYTAVHNNLDSHELEILTALNEVSRVKILITANNNFITNYTNEYNVLRSTMTELGPIQEGDVDFDPGSLPDQNIGKYRYGCDDYENTYNGLASNLISVPCGPYTSPTSLIVPKNSNYSIVDVLENTGHSTGLALTLTKVNTPYHGTTQIVKGFEYNPVIAINDLDSYIVQDSLGNVIDNAIGKIIVLDNSLIFFVSDLGLDISDYVLKDASDNTISDKEFFENRISYVPTSNFSGEDLFSYSVSDADGKLATGTVNVSITGPYALPDYFRIAKNTADNIFDVLLNDGHTNNERISIMTTTTPSHGTINLNIGTSTNVGEITYTPDVDFTGVDSFEYVITDGTITVEGNGDVTTDGTIATGKVDITILDAV